MSEPSIRGVFSRLFSGFYPEGYRLSKEFKNFSVLVGDLYEKNKNFLDSNWLGRIDKVRNRSEFISLLWECIFLSHSIRYGCQPVSFKTKKNPGGPDFLFRRLYSDFYVELVVPGPQQDELRRRCSSKNHDYIAGVGFQGRVAASLKNKMIQINKFCPDKPVIIVVLAHFQEEASLLDLYDALVLGTVYPVRAQGCLMEDKEPIFINGESIESRNKSLIGTDLFLKDSYSCISSLVFYSKMPMSNEQFSSLAPICQINNCKAEYSSPILPLVPRVFSFDVKSHTITSHVT